MDAKNFKEHPKDFWIGDYDFKYLCMPSFLPWSSKKRSPPKFFGVNDKVSVLLAAIMGFQHAIAMVGGIIAPAILIGQTSGSVGIQQYLVASSLMLSGICTIIHVFGFRIPFTNYYYGTGIISVCGSSIAFIGPFNTSIATLVSRGNTWSEAFGKVLGSACVTSFVMIALSFLPSKAVRRIFPPAIAGLALLLIGSSLTAVGMKAWGGGSFCADNYKGLPPTSQTCLVPKSSTNVTFSSINSWTNGTCFKPTIIPLCSTNGDVKLKYGSPQYIGLGALVFLCLVLVEIFGSPFMRNCEIIIALLIGYGIAALLDVNGKRFVTSTQFKAAPAFTFLWTTTFPLGFDAPSVLPLAMTYVVLTVNGIGDIIATEEASGIETVGVEHERRIQGGILADGINSVFSSLAMSVPMTIYAQNNGVIAFTRCASRMVGWSCGIWLIAFGIIAKIGAFFNSIPDCVLGGMTTFLFASIAVSGLKVFSMDPLARRMRFIISLSLGLGIGVAIVPQWATSNLWPVNPHMSSGLRGFRDAIIILLSSPLTFGCLVAIALNLILPFDSEDSDASYGYTDSSMKASDSADDMPKEVTMTDKIPV